MSDLPKPDHQRPELPAFWDHRFRGGATPWDAGRVPQDLAAFAREYRGGRRVLVPGCGSGWEARHLAERGFEVVALDFSAEAIRVARGVLGAHAGCLRHADYFDFDAGGGFDVVYERTFLCAMPRRRWPLYAARTAELVRSGGLLVGSFYFSEEPKGPPFGTTPEGLRALLEPAFVREDDRAVHDSIPLFRGRERWQAWRRVVSGSGGSAGPASPG